MSPSLVQVTVSLRNIRANYARVLRLCEAGGAAPLSCVSPRAAAHSSPCPGASAAQGAAWPSVMAVVKADAYGHGHVETAAALCEEGASAFASGSVDEAARLRQGLAARGYFPRIVALLGFNSRQEAEQAAAHALIPLLHSLWQVECLEACGDIALEVAIKCDTGMSRLGMNAGEVRELCGRLREKPRLAVPVLAVSHLASADSAAGPEEVRKQAREFAVMLAVLRESFPALPASLCNSAGALLARHATDVIGPHICRPGLALYGSNPFAGTPLEHLGRGLLPSMRASAPVVALRRLAKGQAVGYGASYHAPLDMPGDMPVAIVAAGYADGFSRGLSNLGELCVRGARAPVIGRVAMQMIALDLRRVPGVVAPGERAHILGTPGTPGATGDGGLSVEELAAFWGTIPYEALCLLGRNSRGYEE